MPRKSSASLAFSPGGTTSRIRPPDDLDGDARKLFVDLSIQCRPDHFQDSDAAMLAVYCRAVVLEKAASAGLAADGYVMADGKPSGWLNVLQAATRVISTYSRMLRLNPAGRQTVPSSEPTPPVSYYERMALERGNEPDEAN